MRRRGARLVIAACLAVLGVLELEGLARVVRDHSEMWQRVRDEVGRERDAIADAVASGRPGAFAEIESLLPAGVVGEMEIFDETGRRLHVFPTPSGIDDWPGWSDLQRIQRGGLVTRNVAGVPPRIVTYLAVSWRGVPAILRIASPPGEPVLEPSDRTSVVRHGAAIVLLLLLALLTLVSPAPEAASIPGAGALRAYEEAMERLQARGEALSIHHAQERQRLRSELDDKDAMARAGELTSGIVHEVRNGLATIVGYAQLLERSGSPESVEPARRIREECATLEVVVRRFVDFVRHEDLRRAPFDLGRMLSRVATREGRARAGGAVHLPEPLPEIIWDGDEEMLERAFENLVRNARAAAGEGGHVWIEVAASAESVVVAVSDDGPGMSAERRGSIRPFTTSKGGLGLGLATALKIVRLHGGEIVLHDRRPHGLQAAVTLPRAFVSRDSGVI